PPRSPLFPYTDALPISEPGEGVKQPGPDVVDAFAHRKDPAVAGHDAAGRWVGEVDKGLEDRFLGPGAPVVPAGGDPQRFRRVPADRKSTRLNSSHLVIS